MIKTNSQSFAQKV